MTKKNYPYYGLAILAGLVVGFYAGLPLSFLAFLLVCPVMMLLMMAGMHRGSNDHQAGPDTPGAKRPAEPSQQSR